MRGIEGATSSIDDEGKRSILYFNSYNLRKLFEPSIAKLIIFIFYSLLTMVDVTLGLSTKLLPTVI